MIEQEGCNFGRVGGCLLKLALKDHLAAFFSESKIYPLVGPESKLFVKSSKVESVLSLSGLCVDSAQDISNHD